MASPGKGKKDPKAADDGAVNLGTAIKNCFESVFGTESDERLLSEEFFNLINHDRIRLQQEAPIFEARRQRRQERKEHRRREDEEKRLFEKRNNPDNLAACATSIQRMYRGWGQRTFMSELRFCLRDRTRRRAIIILVDQYDDRRVRPPTSAAKDALEMCRMLHLSGFQVDLLSTHGPIAHRPTKANIVKALKDAATSKGQEDGVLWVHVCGCGGIATVSGKNPHKAAHVESVAGQVVTPRTRLLHALKSYHGSGSGSGAGGAGTAVGDQCHYILPSDARSARLTFDSVVSLDDVIDVVAVRPEHAIYNRSTLQRIVTVEASHVGQVEGHRGGGFGFFASTVTPRLLVEYPVVDLSATSATHCVEPFRGILSHGVLRALNGVGWTPIPAFQRLGRSRLQAIADAEKSVVIGDEDAPGLTANNLYTHLHTVLTDLAMTPETSGKGWGDFTVITPERGAVALAFVDRVVASTTASPMSQGEVGGRIGRRRRPLATLRQLSFGCTIRVDVTKKEQRINTYDGDFHVIMGLAIQLFSQTEPSAPVARQLRVTCGKVFPMRRLTVGIGATFVELSTRCKARGYSDTVAFADLVERLTKRPAPPTSPTMQAGTTTAMPTATLPPLRTTSPIAPEEPTSKPGGTTTGGATTTTTTGGVTNNPPAAATTTSPTPAGVSASSPSPSSLGGGSTPYQLWVGKPEEGSVALVLDISSPEDMQHALSQVDAAVPELLCGAPVTALFIDFVVDCHGTVSAAEQLKLAARGACVSMDQLGSAGVTHPSCAMAVVAPNVMTTSAVETLLTQACGALPQAPRRAADWIARVALQRNVRIYEVDPWVQRINDLDDAALDSLARRERSQGSIGQATHAGVALCVIATAAPVDQRLRQLAEMAPFIDLEATHSVRCLVWDVNEAIRSVAPPENTATTTAAAAAAAANVVAVKREKLSRLLDSLRDAIPAACFPPSLLMLDLFKKRYYRATLPPTGGVYASGAIGHFIESFVKGSLNDLLPPVKGCRVYGGSVSKSRYALVAV